MKRPLVFGLLLCLVFPALAQSAERPNLLLIVSEDNGPALGCYGEPHVQTPVLDALAQRGVRFDRAFVPQAGCSQSRAALLTGLYPHQNGQIGLATWKFRLYQEDTPNLVRSLKEGGYRTGIIGKLHINPASTFPFDFEEIGGANFGRKKQEDYARYAGEFMNASEDPFFLYVNYPDAHRPFIPQVDGQPEKPLTADDVDPLAYMGLDSPELRQQTADYYNCMSRLDLLIGDLLKQLDSSGKADDTLIIYMGDHGADLLRGKRTSYEGGTRVPLIIHWPGQHSGNQVSEELVSTLDIMPTLLEAAGVPAPETPGVSLLPLLQGNTEHWRKYLFTEYHLHSAHNYYPQRTVRDHRYKLIRNLMPGEVNPEYDFVRRKFFAGLEEVIQAAPEPIHSAYERMRRPPEFELYDLQTDPYEFTNLADDPQHAATLKRLQDELQSWREETHDPFLDPKNIARLKEEIAACLLPDGEADKSKLTLTYPDYFFSEKP